jgi:hypothetical protein
MEIRKVWRVGGSNVLTVPRSLEADGLRPGAQVIWDKLPTGEIVVRPVESVRERIRAIGREVIAQNRDALDLLEAYDRGELPEQPTRSRAD